MGVTRGYTTNLYCDHEDHESWLLNDEMGEYVGETWAETARDARRDGWHISKDRQTAICPRHNKKKGKAMAEERIFLEYDESVKFIPKGKKIHTFTNAGPALLGSDWNRKDVIKLLKEHKVEVAGPAAQAMKHGLCVDRNGMNLFLATTGRTDGKVKD